MASDSISRSCLKYYKRKSLIDFYDFYNGLNSLPAAICVAKNMACLSSLLFCVTMVGLHKVDTIEIIDIS